MEIKDRIKLMAPLSIYIVWHPDYEDGQQYADHFYRVFSRDAKKPVARGIGMNVFYRSRHLDPKIKLPPIAIPYQNSDYNVIIALIDDFTVIGEGWDKYISDIWENCKVNSQNLFLPVSISKHAYHIKHSISRANFIRPLKVNTASLPSEKLLKKNSVHISNSVSHEICRLLLNNEHRWNMEAVKLNRELIAVSPAPVKLFVSHAKADGEGIAIKIRNYLNSSSSIKTFFDAVDIAPGYDFTTEIKGSIQRSALLVVLTDAYASREWCRKEVIKAKEDNKAVIVVNALENGEARSFPYLGNAPSICWDEDSMEDVVSVSLLEILRQLYQEMQLENLVSGLKNAIDPAPDIVIWPNQPELFSFINILKKFEELESKNKKSKSKGKDTKYKKQKPKKVVLYPDPPLGEEEKLIIESIITGIDLETPSSISTSY